MGSNLTKDEIDQDVIGCNTIVNAKEIVVKKLMRNSEYREKLKEYSVVEKFAHVLSDVTEIKRAYLNLDWTETFKFYEENRSESEQEEKSHLDGKFTSVSQDTDIEKIQEIKKEEMNAIVTQRDMQLKKTIKIKLIISEIAQTSVRKQFRQLVSPILTSIDIAPTFGMFHSALQVGPFLLEWNNSAIAIPRKCMSRAAFLSLDIEAIHTTDRIQEVIDKIADFIVKWNTTMEYVERPKNRKAEGNCQDFVDGILKKLGINMNFDGCVGSYLERLRSQGKADLQFVMDDTFRDHFHVKEKSVVFKTHLELDKFVSELIKVDAGFGSTSYKKEYQLLKSFDRAFWLRYFKFIHVEEYLYMPCKEEDESTEDTPRKDCGCPFGDPEKTMSILFV